jgi:3-dehydrosphinganine reductase
LFVEQGSESFERQMRVNYLGTVHSLQAALPGMLERRRGRLVIVSSSLAVLGFAGVAWVVGWVGGWVRGWV